MFQKVVYSKVEVLDLTRGYWRSAIIITNSLVWWWKH